MADTFLNTEPIVLIETTDVVTPESGNGKRRLIQPPSHIHDWSQFPHGFTLKLLITGTSTGVTSFQMQPRFMLAVPHTTGNIYRQPFWYYADDAELAARTVEGSNFPLITEATALPYVKSRTFKAPLERLIAVDLGSAGSPTPFVATGGSRPALRLALLANPGA